MEFTEAEDQKLSDELKTLTGDKDEESVLRWTTKEDSGWLTSYEETKS